jgi:transcriptional regulator with XRE-family HTH domain
VYVHHVDDPDGGTFGAALLEARLAAGLSQYEIGQLAGVSQTVVSRIERNVGNHRQETYERLRNAVDRLLQQGPSPDFPKRGLAGYEHRFRPTPDDLMRLGDLSHEVRALQRRVDEDQSVSEDTASDVLSLRRELGEHVARLALVSERSDTVSKELHAYLAAITLGLDTGAVPLFRLVPVRLYIDRADPRVITRVSRGVADLLERFGFEVADDFPAIEGSWFKKLFARSREAITSEEAMVRFKQIERAARLPLDKQEAEIAQTYAEAVAAFLEGSAEAEVAVAQFGPLLIVKRPNETGGSSVVTRTLTSRQAAALERHQDLLQRPEDLLEFLAIAEDLPDGLPPGTE